VDFELTADQVELQDAARAVLARECPPAYVRRVAERGEGAGELWSTVCGLDWPALAIPTDVGGLGSSWVELAVVLEELGRAAAPGPFLATVTQFVPLVLEAGSPEQRKRWVTPAAAGELTGTVAIDEGAGTWSPGQVRATVVPAGDGYRLSGRKRFVLDGGTADEIVVAARLDGELVLVTVPGPYVAARHVRPIDGTTRHADLTLDGVLVERDRLLAAPEPGRALERAMEVAVTAVAVSTVGTCQRILDMVVAYVKQREQFGVPVGSFQAVKHKVVDMYRDVERARALGYFSALCIAEDDPRRALAAAMAKASAGECQQRVVQDGLQLFGGMGYTWEHDLHLFLRRAKVGELHLGGAAQHRRRVADIYLASQRAEDPAARVTGGRRTP
jgi:alkylation response protein AidB-like acyl-CoA dehydrogenase